MHTPGGGRRVCSVAVLALVPLLATGAESKEERDRLIRRDVPRYDPAAYEKAQSEKAARQAEIAAAIQAAETPRAPPPAAPAATSLTPPSDPGVLELPTVTVRPTYEPPKALPRMETFRPVGRNDPGEPWETPHARHERLLKKHLSPLQRALMKIPLIGSGIAGSAHEAESREQRARQMNELADGIELQQLLGRAPEEIKRLRAEFTKLYHSGPK